MARQTFEAWIPEEWGGPVFTQIAATSAVEALARTEPMTTDTKHVPRSAGMAHSPVVAKGAAYGEATGTNDEVLLTALKFGQVVRIADEDTKDPAGLINVITQKQSEWARGHSIGFDNACLGTSAAANGTTVPFLSLYQALHTTNSATGYTGDANLTVTASASALTYANISNTFKKIETSDYYSEADTAVIAHPAFKAALRNLVDSQNRPIFIDYSSQGNGSPDRLLGAPVSWTLGAKTNATFTSTPSGSPLLFVGNRQFIVKGDRSGPEYMIAGADSGAAFLTDEHLLKMRIRRGFAVANENAWAGLVLTP